MQTKLTKKVRKQLAEILAYNDVDTMVLEELRSVLDRVYQVRYGGLPDKKLLRRLGMYAGASRSTLAAWLNNQGLTVKDAAKVSEKYHKEVEELR
jgi:hypothetical protein